MEDWSILLNILLLLTAALIMGIIFERLKQSAILGYLLAGILIGPHALKLIRHQESVDMIAELGIALLLFSIGLEFSFKRLKQMGAIAIGGGLIQVTATTIITACICMWLGFNSKTSLAIGCMIALSSTACVLRILIDRAVIDSIYGRNSVGILLLQDMALIPIVLIVNMLGDDGSASVIIWQMGKKILVLIPMVAGFYVLFNYIVPWVLHSEIFVRNRELPILLAINTAMGSAWLAHHLEFSPSIGAFIAGVVLAESPFATQIRSDIVSLRTVLVTLFFSTIGMLANPAWIFQNIGMVLLVTIVVLFGKTVIIYAIARCFRNTHAYSLATGICLAQVGEFSFVLAQIANQKGLITETPFNLILSVTIISLFLTPYLVAFAPTVGSKFQLLLSKNKQHDPHQEPEEDAGPYIIIVGFGPAGQAVGQLLRSLHVQVAVVDLNPDMIRNARDMGFQTYIGDATHANILEHLHVTHAKMVVITIPDPQATRKMISEIRVMSPYTGIIARSRYHVFRWELEVAGAHVVVDEEEQVGLSIAEHVNQHLILLNQVKSEHDKTAPILPDSDGSPDAYE